MTGGGNRYLVPEPAPQASDHPACWPRVIEWLEIRERRMAAPDTELFGAFVQDCRDRHEQGIAKYGTPLHPFNGRDALHDLYQELLDACVYAMQAVMEANLAGDTSEADLIKIFEATVVHAMLIRKRIEERDNGDPSDG